METKEQRKLNRKPLTFHASVSCPAEGDAAVSAPVRTLNLSTKGALIESTEELFTNEVCTFNLVTSDARKVPVQGRIVWVKEYENSTFRAGVAFRNLTADEEYLLSLQLIRDAAT